MLVSLSAKWALSSDLLRMSSCAACMHITLHGGRLACVGDIVLARSVQNPKQIVCKRVLGLEGDEVKVHQSTQLGHSRIVKVSAALPSLVTQWLLCTTCVATS